jgi:hypothetical protein
MVRQLRSRAFSRSPARPAPRQFPIRSPIASPEQGWRRTRPGSPENNRSAATDEPDDLSGTRALHLQPHTCGTTHRSIASAISGAMLLRACNPGQQVRRQMENRPSGTQETDRR